jgi:hypothetical protein
MRADYTAPVVRAPLAFDIDHLLVKHVRFAIEARF